MSQHPSVDDTRLSTQDYLDHLDADVEALIEAATDLEAVVPGCPDWSVGDLLSHVVGVYRNKSAALETDLEPVLGFESWGAIEPGQDVREVLRAEYSRLRELLTARPAETPTWTWWPAEQTIGFWQRRMAQETAVHRWDAQSAVLGVDGADPIDDDLADDGVDELLSWLTWPWDEEALDDAAGQTVLVSSGVHSWTLAFTPTRVTVEGGVGDAVSLVAGPPSGLLLHLWGRPGNHDVATGGDVVALSLLQQRLAMLVS